MFTNIHCHVVKTVYLCILHYSTRLFYLCLYISGLTAFDFITDYEEWVDSGHFSDEMRARLKGN